MSRPGPRDFFDKARITAAVLIVAAGLAALVGTFMEWVTIEPPATVPQQQAYRLDAFTGMETSDGPFILIGAVVLLVSAGMLLDSKRSAWAWIAFFASIAIGAIGIGDYRSIDSIFYDELQRIGRPTPAFGLLLVAAAGIVGLVGSVAGIAASPKRSESV